MGNGAITPDLSADPNAIPLPDPTTLAGQVQLNTVGGGAPAPMPPTAAPAAVNDIGAAAATRSPLGPVLEQNRWALTKPAGNYQQVPGYMQASVDPNTGQPAAMNPSLTKLGKLLTVLRAAGVGATVGSTQPTFGSGFQAAQGNQNQQINQHLQQQQSEIGLEQSRANLGMVNTPWGAMPMGLYRSILPKVLPAQIAGESRENVAGTAADSRLKVAQLLGQSRESIAKYNADSRAKIAGVQGVELTPEMATKYNIPSEFVGTKIKPSDYAAMTRATVFEDIPLMTAAGPIIVNRKTGQARPVEGEGGQTYQPPALASPRLMADPDHPGDSISVPAGQSFGMAGPDSASMQVPKAAMKAEVPKNIGDRRIAFQTMLDHAALLRTAAQALKNGNSRTLAGLSNKFQTEFGSPDVTNFDAIANAYNHEVTDVIAKGHLTDPEVKEGKATLPSNASLDTIDKVLDSYEALAKSKMKNLDRQEQAANDRAQANRKTKPGNAPPPTAPGAPHPFFQKYGGVADQRQ